MENHTRVTVSILTGRKCDTGVIASPLKHRLTMVDGESLCPMNGIQHVKLL